MRIFISVSSVDAVWKRQQWIINEIIVLYYMYAFVEILTYQIISALVEEIEVALYFCLI